MHGEGQWHPSLGLNFPQLLVRKFEKGDFSYFLGIPFDSDYFHVRVMIWVEAGICTQMGHFNSSQTLQFISVNEKGPSPLGKSEGQLCQDAGSCIMKFLLSAKEIKELHTLKMS